MTHRLPWRLGGAGRALRLAAVFSCVIVSNAVGEQAEQAAPAPAPEAQVDEYRIGPEDVLKITVWQNAELTHSLPVRPDGKISLPLINDVQAAGLTPMQLRDALKQRLAEYVPAAEVSP